MNKKELEDLLEYYEIESVEEFESRFYTMNLVNGYEIGNRAIKNLKEYFKFNPENMLKIKNYDECGIVEYVAKGDFEVVDDYIVPLE